MNNTVSIREFARLEGVSDTLVHRALKVGRLARAADGGIDRALVGSAWRASPKRGEAIHAGANTTANSANTPADMTATLPGGTPPKGVAYGEALRLKENWIALLRRLEYEHKSGALIELSAAQRVVFDLCREQRDAWLAWPARIAPFLAAEFAVSDLERLVAFLNEHVYQQLAELGEPNPRFEAAAA
ncbi:Putative bacteriophage--like protein [Burkholderia diffusa]|uniref:hypothetical protein n=1 Tax=Burkholderia diffusa TaxID=488732 RepID=UPI001CB21DED|nr:hypothetical protein [Burkholderia diffusa]CAG9264757.1 Putative bacteriophage--like protein [Burkholderia diffusa]